MTLEDFMNGNQYDTEAETITGYFRLDDKVMRKNMKTIIKALPDVERKSDILLQIDALTDNKMESIVLASLLFENLGGRNEDIAKNIAMALSIAMMEDIISMKDAERMAEIFTKVFTE